MKIKGTRQLRQLTLDTSKLSSSARASLEKKIGDVVIAGLQKKYAPYIENYYSRAWGAYLKTVADYLGTKGNTAFRVPGGLGRYRRKAAKGTPQIPDHIPSATVQISMTLPVPTATSLSGMQADDGAFSEIAFSTTFAGLARRTVKKKLKLSVARYWKQSGNTMERIGRELQALARGKPASVQVTWIRIPAQPGLAKKGSVLGRYQMVLSIHLRGPSDPAWAEMLAESFASGIIRTGQGKLSAFGVTPNVRSIFNETGFTNTSGVTVPARAWIQQLGKLAGGLLAQQLRRIK